MGSGTKPKTVLFPLIISRKLNLTISRSFQLLTSSDCRIQCLPGGGLLHRAVWESIIQEGHWRISQPFIQIIERVRISSFNALLNHSISFLISLTTDETSFLEPSPYSLLLPLKGIYFHLSLYFYPLELNYIGH